MAYRPLLLPAGPGPHATDLIRRLEGHYLQDVHAMLRLPQPSVDIHAGCNFAIAQVLCAVIGGLSTTLYMQEGGNGHRFKGILIDYYPWDEEPIDERRDSEHAALIYSMFRNPLTHDLGLDLHSASRSPKAIVKRLVVQAQQVGHTERGVEDLEADQRPGNLSPVLRRDRERVVLMVEAMYWGVRRLIVRIAADTERMAGAESFFVKRAEREA